MKIRFRRADIGWHPDIGLGLYYNYGCVGSTYGEDGSNMSFSLTLLVLWFKFQMYMTWKRYD